MVVSLQLQLPFPVVSLIKEKHYKVAPGLLHVLHMCCMGMHVALAAALKPEDALAMSFACTYT